VMRRMARLRFMRCARVWGKRWISSWQRVAIAEAAFYSP
jgi:hypothetical protein